MEQKIQKAGALILSSENNNTIALLYRAKQNDWSFPKGHVEEGENTTEAMIREIQEETGLGVRIIKELPNSEYSSEGEGSISTKMFLVQSEDDSKLKLEHEGDKIEWVPFDQVLEKLSYDNLRNYFKSIEW